MIRSCGKWIPVPGEGGHVELGPLSEEEYRIWPHLERIGGRVGAEQVVCGAGLIRLASAVLKADGAHRTYEKPSDVPMAADGGDEVAQKVLRLFCAALGRVPVTLRLLRLHAAAFIWRAVFPRRSRSGCIRASSGLLLRPKHRMTVS